jgi:ABC-type transport system involved in multi-copper enzyme maturation permease subunit
MISLLIQKELKNIILSPKFFATFLICSILILLSVYIGIKEYHNSVQQFKAVQELAHQDISQATGWSRIKNSVHREPSPMQIFVSGLHFDIGRLSSISNTQDIKLIRSPYSDEPIFAMFRIIDFAFIVQMVLSLFAILFTYDSINGEREYGTLKLAFANSISRSTYLISKLFGIWLGLIIPLFIPILSSLLLIVLFEVPLLSEHWISILSFLALSMIYITLFIVIGVFLSALTRHSSLSFLLLLVIWIGSVFVIPRLGVVIAGQFITVESVAQIESKQEAFQKSRWDEYFEYLTNLWKDREKVISSMNEEEAKKYRDNKEWEWLEEDDTSRKQVQLDIIENNRRLIEEVQNKKRIQERYALNLSRISPAASYHLAAMKLASTDITMKVRYEESMRNYKDIFSKYISEKIAEGGNTGGINISIDSKKGSSIDFGRDDQTLDTSDMPNYTAPLVRPIEAIGNSIPDFGILLLLIILCFGGCFFAFLRYDMR